MAYSVVDGINTDLDLVKWESDYWTEYVRESGFKPYMGSGVNSIIQTKRDLINGGMDLIVPLVASLKGRGTGAGLLTGNEEKVDYYSFRSRPYWRRNAVVVKKSQQQKSAIDILQGNKDVLKLWSTDDMRDRMVDALSVVDEQDTHYDEDEGIGRQVTFAEATATQKNNWLSDNANRVLFGITEANLSAGNFTTSIGNVDGTADNWSATIIDAAKTMAKRRNRATGVRGVRPYRNGDNGNEYYVLFVGTRSMNKLRADADIKAFNKDARPRENEGLNNPVFQGGDLMWNGVIVHEIPELPTLTGAGAASVDVEPGYLCGAQALIVGWGQDPTTTMRKDDDYGFIKGVGVEELRSVDKTFFKDTSSVGPGLQHGVVSIFAAV
jgi:N4-gp56 family major capsid protein